MQYQILKLALSLIQSEIDNLKTQRVSQKYMVTLIAAKKAIEELMAFY